MIKIVGYENGQRNAIFMKSLESQFWMTQDPKANVTVKITMNKILAY